MARRAKLDHFDGKIVLDLYPDEERQWIAADPDDCEWRLYIYADHVKLEQGKYEIVGIEALDVSDITDESLSSLSALGLQHIDIIEIGVRNASISDVLRWARETYPSRYSAASV